MDIIRFAQQVQAIAHVGLTYAENPFDLERYKKLAEMAVEMLSEGLGLPPERVREAVADEPVYPTPKVDVRAVVFHEGKVLLVLERATGRWTLPGGWADIGDAPSEAAAREAFEEAGFRVRPIKLLAVYDKSRHGHPKGLLYIYKLFVRCELLGGEATESHETGGAAFFGPDELPPLDAHRVTADQLRRLFEHLADPNLPTDFD